MGFLFGIVTKQMNPLIGSCTILLMERRAIIQMGCELPEMGLGWFSNEITK
jgi:hypothetical protein